MLNVLECSDLSKYDSILIPEIIFNQDGLTLDDINIDAFKDLHPQIRIVKDNGKDLVKNLAG